MEGHSCVAPVIKIFPPQKKTESLTQFRPVFLRIPPLSLCFMKTQGTMDWTNMEKRLAEQNSKATSLPNWKAKTSPERWSWTGQPVNIYIDVEKYFNNKNIDLHRFTSFTRLMCCNFFETLSKIEWVSCMIGDEHKLMCQTTSETWTWDSGTISKVNKHSLALDPVRTLDSET